MNHDILISLNDVYGCVKLVKANVMIKFFFWTSLCVPFFYSTHNIEVCIPLPDFYCSRFPLLSDLLIEFPILCACIGCTLLWFLRVSLYEPALVDCEMESTGNLEFVGQ